MPAWIFRHLIGGHGLRAELGVVLVSETIDPETPLAYAGIVSRIFGTQFSAVYPLYVAKVERKGRTKMELDQVIMWLTGFDDTTLRRHAQGGT
ncbi:DUF2200 family protein, partial [Glaciimonas sp. Cout2]|uniref:DUF2200 family protein n=1 Tax=Glaciimonas sp. Cout2 TaxID=3048621 RepID=UPI002B239BDA